jgi:hypothetical protein
MPFRNASASAEKEKKRKPLHMSGYRTTPQFGSTGTAQQTATTAATTTAAAAPVPIPTPTPQTQTSQTEANTDREQFTAALHALASSDIDPASPQLTVAMTALLSGGTSPATVAPTQTQTTATAMPTTVAPTTATPTQTTAIPTPPTVAPTTVAPTQTQTTAIPTPPTVAPTQTRTTATATPTTAAPVQAQPWADATLPTPPAGVHDKELLTRSKLMQREAFQGDAASMPEARTLINAVENYEQTVNGFTIPVSGGEAFVRDMGRINAGVTAAHEQLMNIMVQTSMTMRKASQSKLPRALTRLNPRFAHARKLADDCAQLANIMQSQKIYINKIYDDMVNAAQTNPAYLRQFFGKSYAEVIRNMDMYRFNSSGANVSTLGAGAINTVYRDKVRQPGSTAARDVVFKRGKVHEYKYNQGQQELNTAFDVLESRMKAQQEEMPAYMPERREATDPATPEYMREDQRQKVIREVHTANRDVAYSRLNALFGFDISVRTQLSKSEEGDTSSLMDMGSGRDASSFLFYTGGEWAETASAWANADYQAEIEKMEELISKLREDLSGEQNPQFQERLKADLASKQAALAKLKKRGAAPTLNLADPRLSLQFFKMSVLDLVAGHVDRHAGNYMIDVSAEGGPRLTAIDNDTSFGPTTDIETSKQMQGTGQVRPALEEAFAFVPPEVKNRVMEVTEEDIRNTLAGLLTEPQITAACIRFDKLQKHFEKLEKEGNVRDVSETNRYEPLSRQPLGSYQSGLFQDASKNLFKSVWFQQNFPVYQELVANIRRITTPPGARPKPIPDAPRRQQ